VKETKARMAALQAQMDANIQAVEQKRIEQDQAMQLQNSDDPAD
jgi:hypothetical protein